MSNRYAKYVIEVEVETPDGLSREEVRRLVDRMVNCGYEDAQDTIEGGEGDLEQAQRVANFNISVK